MKLMFPEGNVDADCPELVWGKLVSCEFRKRVVQISKRLECDPNHLMAIMALETHEPKAKRRFNPAVDNGLGKDADGIGYVGLIQFGNDAITDLNKNYFLRKHKSQIKKKHLKAMSAVEQLCYVEYFLTPKKGKLNTLADFYLAVLLPYDVGRGNEKNHVVFDSSLKLNYNSKGEVIKDLNFIRKKGYAANATFFKEKTDAKSNSNGKTYVWEIADRIQEVYDEGIAKKNTSNDCTCHKCNHDQKCIDLTGKVTWISQFNKYEWGVHKTGKNKGKKYIKGDACWRTSRRLLFSAGLSKNSGLTTDMIITALEDNDHKNLTLTGKAKDGVDYIDTELEKGNPVLVGLNHTLNYTLGGKEAINQYPTLGDPGTTDHFVVIVGRGIEDGKTHYRFYEVGTPWAHKGQHSDNKLFLDDSDYSLKGTPVSNKKKNYTVTQVRKNK